MTAPGAPQARYSSRFGPTTGDRVRLADTNLWLRVEDDHVGYGDEPLWGYGKNIRSRMTQDDSATTASELDVLIAGVLLVDPLLGVVKTNIGIKDGRIAGVGRAGNPDITAGVELTIGPNTMPLTALHCSGFTPHCWAAAEISIARALAPISRCCI